MNNIFSESLSKLMDLIKARMELKEAQTQQQIAWQNEPYVATVWDVRKGISGVLFEFEIADTEFAKVRWFNQLVHLRQEAGSVPFDLSRDEYRYELTQGLFESYISDSFASQEFNKVFTCTQRSLHDFDVTYFMKQPEEKVTADGRREENKPYLLEFINSTLKNYGFGPLYVDNIEWGIRKMSFHVIDRNNYVKAMNNKKAK